MKSLVGLRRAVKTYVAPARMRMSPCSTLSFDSTSPLALKNKFRTRLSEAKEQSLIGGGQKRIDTQHKKGKLTARERLLLLLDEGSFREYDALKTHRCDEFGMDKEHHYGDGV